MISMPEKMSPPEAVEPQEKESVHSRRTFLKVAAGAAAFFLGEESAEAKKKHAHHTKKPPTHETPHQPTGEIPLAFDRHVAHDLAQTYDQSAVDAAVRVILNGASIRLSPKKDVELPKVYETVEQKFSGRIKIPKFFGYCDEPEELRQITAIDFYRRKVAQGVTDEHLEMPIEFVIAAMSNEGTLLNTEGGDRWNQPIGGYGQLGLDWFSDDFPRLVKRGLLPKSFSKSFQVEQHYNEKQQAVNSAVFTSKGAAINAFIAELGYRQLMFLDACQSEGINLEKLSSHDREDIKTFFTYIYYNLGPTKARSLVATYNSAAKLLEFFKIAEQHPEKIDLASSPANAYVVLAGANFLKKSGAVDPHPAKGNYWWTKEKKVTAKFV